MDGLMSDSDTTVRVRQLVGVVSETAYGWASLAVRVGGEGGPVLVIVTCHASQ